MNAEAKKNGKESDNACITQFRNAISVILRLSSSSIPLASMRMLPRLCILGLMGNREVGGGDDGGGKFLGEGGMLLFVSFLDRVPTTDRRKFPIEEETDTLAVSVVLDFGGPARKSPKERLLRFFFSAASVLVRRG